MQKRLLFIGSESYDAPTITVLQGLAQLGFTIYTIDKSNINSWFCNQVIEDVGGLEFDFVLSNLHWGTRWSHYARFGLHDYPKVLIDGDDDFNQGHWLSKFKDYKRKYVVDPPEEVKDRELMPYRWVEPLHGYEPDVVFTAQKQPSDRTTEYLPFGIHEEYVSMYEGLHSDERPYWLTHIPGPGKPRGRMKKLIDGLKRTGFLPENVVNEKIYGEVSVPNALASYVDQDDNVHSYHRWVIRKEYFEVLNRSQILVYPGVDHWPFWDSKRPWEAYASGCLVLMAQPSIDVSAYPLTEICPEAVYRSIPEFLWKLRKLNRHPVLLEELRQKAVERAWTYFRPKPIARYFLTRIAHRLGWIDTA